MKLPYIGKLYQGNEAFGTGQSLSVEEKPIGTASPKQIAEHIHMMNGLIPVDVAEAVWNLLGDVAIHFMAQGYRVPFNGRGYSLGSMYAAGGEFTENIDACGGEGTAAFVDKAIRVFCGNSLS